MAEQASLGVIDFTNVKEGGGSFNKKRQPEGDYKAKVTKVVDAPSKKDQTAQWLFTIEVGGGSYPYYCKHEENQFWKIRNILVAAGISVPKKKVRVDPNKVVGKYVAVTLSDDEYNGKAQSEVSAVFPLSELSDDAIGDEDEDQVDDVDDDGEEEPPPPPKKKKAPEPEPEEDEEEDEDDADPLAALDRTALKAIISSEGLALAVKKSMSDDDIREGIKVARAAATSNDDDEDDDEDPAPPPPKVKAKTAAKPKPAADDDDLEEIDIDDA